MIQIVIGIVIFLLYIGYLLILKPKRLYDAYVQNFKKQGYRVLQGPFLPMGSSYDKFYNRSPQAQDGYSLVKQQYSKNDVAILNIMNIVLIDIIHPQLAKQFYSQEKQLVLHKTKLQTDSFKRLIKGFGNTFEEGERWRKKRKILGEVFNFQFIKNLSPKVAQICGESLHRCQNKDENKLEEKQFVYNVVDYGFLLSVSVIMECFFGKKLKHEKIEGQEIGIFLKELINDMMFQTIDIFYVLFGTKFLNLGLRKKDRDVTRRIKILNEWCKQIVKQRTEQIKKNQHIIEEPSDLMESLVLGILKQKQAGQEPVYGEEDIIGQFIAFFVGGTDTTSHFIMMMIYLISEHPHIEAKVREEIDTYLKEDDYSYENLKNLTYIDCVQKEVTRFYGPGNGLFFRNPINDDFLKGIPIKKGTFISVQCLGLHFSEEHYKNPYEFRPQRWINECDNVHPYAISGFGGGRRTCIGKHLSRLESKIALVRFMKQYSKIDLPNQKYQMTLKFLYAPEPMKIKLTR